MVAWLMCWYMSMSDQRTCTGATKRHRHPEVPVPLVRVMLRIWRAATDNVARSRSPRLVDLGQACAGPAARGSCWSVSHSAIFSSPRLVRLAHGQHVEAQRPQRTVDVVANRQARQRMPAVVARQPGHRGQQAVGAEVVHQREVGVGHLGRVAVDDVGDVDDVEQAVLVQARSRPCTPGLAGTPCERELAGFLLDDGAGRRRAATPTSAASARRPSRRTG